MHRYWWSRSHVAKPPSEGSQMKELNIMVRRSTRGILLVVMRCKKTIA